MGAQRAGCCHVLALRRRSRDIQAVRAQSLLLEACRSLSKQHVGLRSDVRVAG